MTDQQFELFNEILKRLNIQSLINFLPLLISGVTLIVLLYNWKLRKPKIKFEETDINEPKSYYFETTGLNNTKFKEFSTHIAVVYVKLYNMSELPITVGKFSIDNKVSGKAYYRASTEIFQDVFIETDNPSRQQIIEITEKHIKMPLTLKSFDYVEGFIVFPYIQNYEEEFYNVEITAYTARKNFIWKTKLFKVNCISYEEFEKRQKQANDIATFLGFTTDNPEINK